MAIRIWVHFIHKYMGSLYVVYHQVYITVLSLDEKKLLQ